MTESHANQGEEEAPQSEALQAIDPSLPVTLIIMPTTQRPAFPGMVLPLVFSGAERIEAIELAIEEEDGWLGIVLARDTDEDDYRASDLYKVGTAYKILKAVRDENDNIQLFGRAVRRFRCLSQIGDKPVLRWKVGYEYLKHQKAGNELKAYMLAISNDVRELLQINQLFQEQVNMVVNQLNSDQPEQTMDVISNLLGAEKERLQELLETSDLKQRANLLLTLLKNELEVARIQARINKKIEKDVNAQQKEFFLRQQLQAIKKELGEEVEEGESIAAKINEQLKDKVLPEQAQKAINRELRKLESLNAQSPEFNITRTYLETLAELPWGIYTEDSNEVAQARIILNEDHYGLEDVKDNILEFLATILKRGSVAGSIICLVGPPGVGKTSIGKSIAKALGREFFRFSVGGMRDEAEIKGHRRTYIGAMPGKLIEALRRVGSSNPVIMLDEIDKIGNSFRGDPASALLEVLDPEQNDSFLDNYLDVPYDLSNVLFLATANQLDTIPGPLLDRMEVIRLSGYVMAEKIEIARRYLIPKQLEDHGFSEKEIQFEVEALRFLTDRYAREAGVRGLEKQLRKIFRKLVLEQSEAPDKFDPVIDSARVEQLLGKPHFNPEKLYEKSMPGVVLGLAYTSLGGTTLYIEAQGIASESSGLKLTGQLGDVMKESAQIALSYVKSLLKKSKNDYLDKHQVHLHVPAGATPKDGPSAGITMALALYSLATDSPVRDQLAMTGELTLTGRVLPIGGVKEKTIGARRVGINTLIFPEENRRDFEELPDYITEGISAHFASNFDEVLKVAFF